LLQRRASRVRQLVLEEREAEASRGLDVRDPGRTPHFAPVEYERHDDAFAALDVCGAGNEASSVAEISQVQAFVGHCAINLTVDGDACAIVPPGCLHLDQAGVIWGRPANWL
jgi:hypothetical protein